MEQLVYDRLEPVLTPTPIYPTTPTQDSDLPYVVYYRIGTNPVGSNQGTTHVTNYTLAVEVVATSLDAARPLADTITSTLRGKWGTVQFCNQIGDETVQELEDGFHHLILNFSLWI